MNSLGPAEALWIWFVVFVALCVAVSASYLLLRSIFRGEGVVVGLKRFIRTIWLNMP
jgi:hypothetical protein